MRRIWDQYFPKDKPIIIDCSWEVVMEIYGCSGTTIYFMFKKGWFE